MPSPRDALPPLIAALRAAFGDDLRCVLFKGSAMKGDHIPYFSDLDIHAMVDGVGDTHAPDWVRALAFQRLIGPVEPEAYEVGAFQVEFTPGDRYPEDWPVPYPRTYEVVDGTAPIGGPSAEAHLTQAREQLANVERERDELVRQVVDRSDRTLVRPVRLLGTFLSGRLRSAATLLTGDPERVYTSARAPLVHIVGEEVGNEREMLLFYALAQDWREVRQQPEQLRAMFATGIAAFEMFSGWSP